MRDFPSSPHLNPHNNLSVHPFLTKLNGVLHLSQLMFGSLCFHVLDVSDATELAGSKSHNVAFHTKTVCVPEAGFFF